MFLSQESFLRKHIFVQKNFWILNKKYPVFCRNIFGPVARRTCWVTETAKLCPQEIFWRKVLFVKKKVFCISVLTLRELGRLLVEKKIRKFAKFVFILWWKKCRRRVFCQKEKIFRIRFLPATRFFWVLVRKN